MRILCVLLLLTVSAQAQWARSSAVQAAAVIPILSSPSYFSPTNIAGYPAYTWYVPDGHYFSSSGFASLTNLATGVTNENLSMTNMVVATDYQPTIADNALNGKDALLFDGVNDYLVSQCYTSPQPHEVYMVCKFDMPTAATRNLFGNGSAPRNTIRFDTTTNTTFVVGGSTLTGGRPPVNTWLVLGYSFTAGTGNTKAWTNNVEEVSGTLTGNAGATYIGGVPAGNLKLWLVEWVSFQTNLPAVQRTNLYDYFKAKYAL